MLIGFTPSNGGFAKAQTRRCAQTAVPDATTIRVNKRQVEVHVAGTWSPGRRDPDDWRRVDGRWSAMVRYKTGMAENRIGGFDQDDIRRT